MSHWLSSHSSSHAPARLEFAAAQSAKEIRLILHLQMDERETVAPILRIVSPTVGCRLDPASPRLLDGNPPRIARYVLVVEPSPHPEQEDDRVEIVLEGDGVPRCVVELRRTRCDIHAGLLARGDPHWKPHEQTLAALRWRAWRRYSQLVGLKRFSSGLSGSDVLVFRPCLRQPGDDTSLGSSGPLYFLDGCWGSWLLVKTGDTADIHQEWDRFDILLRDRLSPFLSRLEEWLPTLPLDAEVHEPRSTLIASFLGGDLVRAEPLEQVLRSSADLDCCRQVLDRVFAVLEPWYATGVPALLHRWPRVFRPVDQQPFPESLDLYTDTRPWLLLNKFDLSHERRPDPQRERGPDNPDGREEFTAGLRWDIDFITRDHLHHYLLGRRPDQRDGLLYHLMKIKARFSLAHGDLNPRNVLCDEDNVWLIDFEHTGVAPSLGDLARLEVNLRLWCLSLEPRRENLEEAATGLETHLLDHFHGSEGGLEPVRRFAAGLGADPGELLKIAHCIAHIRRRAASLCVHDYADRRDYLAVLYLTILSLLPYANQEDARPANFRLLSLAWVLEDTLAAILGVEPFHRRQRPLQPVHLLHAEWLRPDGAPQRVQYLMDSPDGALALAPLAATRGVYQNPAHHLDVFDHTLLVLAYVEGIRNDPLGSFRDPAKLDLRVQAALREQGLQRLLVPMYDANPTAPVVEGWTDAHSAAVEALFERALQREDELLLKWTALLHDVGKPGTRGQGEKAGRPAVHFIGHEIYGLQLLKPILEDLFDEAGAVRLRMLITEHHRANQLVSKYTDPQSGARLRRELFDQATTSAQRRWSQKQTTFWKQEIGEDACQFALLLLHGLADRMARRGYDNRTSIQQESEILLALLACVAFFDRV